MLQADRLRRHASLAAGLLVIAWTSFPVAAQNAAQNAPATGASTQPANLDDPNARKLEGVEAALSASRQKEAALAAATAALRKEMADIQASLVQRAAAAQAAERELNQVQQTLTTLQEAREAKAAELDEKRKSLMLSLAALERLAMTPPGAVLAKESPVEFARSSLLLRYAVPELERRAAGLAGDLAQMDSLGRQIQQRRARAQGVAVALAQDRQQLTELLKRKTDLQRQMARQSAANVARIARLAAQAQDLRELLDKLATEKPQSSTISRPANVRPFPSKTGSLISPVSGRQVGPAFGTLDSVSASTARGIYLETLPGATVVAPFDGQILFRGPFRSYGEILIIQHDGGYHSVLAGLARIDAVVGQWVLAGEPVGVMGPSQGSSPRLYLELRRDGHPIDPVPWLGNSDSKME